MSGVRTRTDGRGHLSVGDGEAEAGDSSAVLDSATYEQ